MTLDTQEFYNEQWVTIQGDFRVYDSWEESMDDHTMLFVNGVDWNPALYVNVLSATDYKTAAKAYCKKLVMPQIRIAQRKSFV